MSIENTLYRKLESAFQPQILNVINQSHLHAGHSGDDGSGESHFKVEIQSKELEGLSYVSAQRKIFHVLDDEMKIIHALSIKVLK